MICLLNSLSSISYHSQLKSFSLFVLNPKNIFILSFLVPMIDRSVNLNGSINQNG